MRRKSHIHHPALLCTQSLVPMPRTDYRVFPWLKHLNHDQSTHGKRGASVRVPQAADTSIKSRWNAMSIQAMLSQQGIKMSVEDVEKSSQVNLERDTYSCQKAMAQTVCEPLLLI